MGIPVRLKIDGFVHLGESFDKGDIFNAPHEAFASFLCEQEGNAERVAEKDCEPEQVGTMKRVSKVGTYNTRVVTPDEDSSGTPKTTKRAPVKKTAKQKAGSDTTSETAKQKAGSDAASENT